MGGGGGVRRQPFMKFFFQLLNRQEFVHFLSIRACFCINLRYFWDTLENSQIPLKIADQKYRVKWRNLTSYNVMTNNTYDIS